MNSIENLKTFPSKSYTNVTGKERILFVDPKDAKRGTTPPVNYMELQTLASLVNSGSMQFENIDYATLYSKVVNGELTPLQWYRLTDYKNVNYLNGWFNAYNNPTPTDPNFDPREVFVGNEEVLYLQAISNSELSPIGYSETYKDDIIEFNPYVNKMGTYLQLFNGAGLPDLTTLSGFDLKWDGTNVYFDMPTGYPIFFGHFLYIGYTSINFYGCEVESITNQITQPTSTNANVFSRIKVSNDGTRVVLLDLVEQDYLDYQVDSLYVEHIEALNDVYGWITRRKDTANDINVPFDFRSRTYRRFAVDVSSIFPSVTDPQYIGIGDDFNSLGTTGDYVDVLSINWKEYKVYGVYIDGIGGPESLSSNFVCENVFFKDLNLFKTGKLFSENTFIDECNDSNFGDLCYFNYVLGSFEKNDIKTNFYFNAIISAEQNNIDDDFQSNVIQQRFSKNQIGSDFIQNNVGGNFQYNVISLDFGGNTIGDFFNTNNIKYAFQSNTIGDFFQSNDIGNSFMFNTISDSFNYNIIGDEFTNNDIGLAFNQNTISYGFQSNTIGENFYNNDIFGSNFQGNTIVDDFRYNHIKTSIQGYNFSFSTLVYGNYNCDLFIGSDGYPYLSYFDGSSIIYNPITD